jgi:hypothetical protein
LAAVISAGRPAPNTAQGHPRAIFRRAIERGNLILAAGMARELGQSPSPKHSRLVALVAQKVAGALSGPVSDFQEVPLRIALPVPLVVSVRGA